MGRRYPIESGGPDRLEPPEGYYGDEDDEEEASKPRYAALLGKALGTLEVIALAHKVGTLQDRHWETVEELIAEINSELGVIF